MFLQQAFINWLTEAEKSLGNLKPVSRVLETIKVQIEEHKEFQNEVSSQRETMLSRLQNMRIRAIHAAMKKGQYHQ